MIATAPNPEGGLDFLLKSLSHLLCRELEQRIQQEGVDLTRGQWSILCQVSLREGCRQRELAESLQVGAATVGRQIESLVAAGWLERRDDPRDGRAHQLYVRFQARNVLVQLRRPIAQLREEFFTGIPLERREALIDDLLVIRKNLLAYRARTEDRLAAPRYDKSPTFRFRGV
jgi:DNA-binding MarR family transcriptional regulator